MAITRAPRPQGNFYILDKSISEDSYLTWGARGLLVYLLGKPDHWEVSVQALVNETVESRVPSGRDSVRAYLTELINRGYMRRTRARMDGGKLAGYDYSVSEIRVDTPQTLNPSMAPQTDQPATAQPATANPPQVSIESLVKTDIGASKDIVRPIVVEVTRKTPEQMAKEQESKERAKAQAKAELEANQAAFPIFWTAGMVKVAKPKAFQSFVAAVKKSGLPADEFAGNLRLDVQERLKREQFGFDKMHPTTYLNQERYNDQMPPQAPKKPGQGNHHGLNTQCGDGDNVMTGGL